MSPNCTVTDTIQNAILTDDQQNACERLLALARVRASTTEANLPLSVLIRWSVPVLIGPAGVGKAFVCAEVARRLGNQPFRRWDLGSWSPAFSLISSTMPAQIRAFIASHPAGCVVYLAGLDALAQTGYSVSYYRAMASEIEQLLDGISMRLARSTRSDGKVIPANVLLVVGGCFAPLWREATIDGPSGAEWWKLADRVPLADPVAVANWLWEYSGLPAGILQRLAYEPTLLRPLGPAEAGRLAARLCERLLPSLDGLGTDEFCAALQSPHGWGAVAALIERAWIEGHEDLPLPEASAAAPAKQNPPPAPLNVGGGATDGGGRVPAGQNPPPVPPGTKLVAGQPPTRLGERLGIPSNRSLLLGKARRLGLRTVLDFMRLAEARGYSLSRDTYRTAVPERGPLDAFSDTELTAALLSPCLEYNESGICQGALMLDAQLATTIDQAFIVYQARRARGETVMRHVARIWYELYSPSGRGRDLLALLPSFSDRPAFPPGVMPDDAIREVLIVSRIW